MNPVWRHANMDATITDTTFPARDGFSLAATVFAPPEPRSAVLINSATAVPRKIYRGFAEYLAERGLCRPHLRLSRHRGSRPASLRGFDARMRDWAMLDVAGAIDHAAAHWPGLRLQLHRAFVWRPGIGAGAEQFRDVARALLVGVAGRDVAADPVAGALSRLCGDEGDREAGRPRGRLHAGLAGSRRRSAKARVSRMGRLGPQARDTSSTTPRSANWKTFRGIVVRCVRSA